MLAAACVGRVWDGQAGPALHLGSRWDAGRVLQLQAHRLV